MPTLQFERMQEGAAVRTDAITRRMQYRLALRRMRTRPARRAINTLAVWMRSGAPLIEACRAALRAWS